MKTVRICIFTLLLAFIVNMVQAQQSDFEGTWVGERSPVDRSAYRIIISGNNWQQFFNNQIEAAGTARFSAGRAELLLADGRLAWDLRLLAPGLIEQPVSMWAGLYRFRLVQPSSLQPNVQTDELFSQNIYVQGFGVLQYLLANDSSLIEVALNLALESEEWISLDDANWAINPNLSQNVRNVMNRLDVNYSITVVGGWVSVNRRTGNTWWFASFLVSSVGGEFLR